MGVGELPFLPTPSSPPSAPKTFIFKTARVKGVFLTLSFLWRRAGFTARNNCIRDLAAIITPVRTTIASVLWDNRGIVTYSHYLRYTWIYDEIWRGENGHCSQVWTEIHSHALKVVHRVDWSQLPTFPWDRRYRARLTVNGGNLDFKCTESELGKGIKSA